ncbi:MAG: hypothetical protein JNK15_12185 [Planctomycetes bacterium]|nr:hypothetical protein [Planctomycetota bacterium]
MLLRCLVPVVFAVAALPAQCGLQWSPGDVFAGANNGVDAAIPWDPDGPGPAGEQLVVAGWFQVVANVRANYIARFDPASGQWASFGTGMNAPVYALLALPNGDLVAGGAFSSAGGVPVANLARWNGTAWTPIGAGLPTTSGQFGVRALARLPNGDLVAGGNFWLGPSTLSIARWDGTSWSALGGGITGFSGSTVFALLVRSNGDLVMGGQFDNAGGLLAANIASWDGTWWSPLGSGCDSHVQALAEGPNGELVAGGYFDHAGGVPAARIAAWNGTTWSPLGAGMPGLSFGQGVFDLTRLPNGDLVAGGTFPVAGSTTVDHLARWDGSTWSTLGGVSALYSGVFALATMATGELVVGGNFTSAGGVPTRSLARLGPGGWSAFASGMDGYLTSAVTLPNGDLLVGGAFTQIGGVAANNVARRVGGAWQPLGAGTDTLVGAVAVLQNGDVVVGGQIAAAGGTAVNRIARWDGSTWHPLGSGVTGGLQPEVWSLHVRPNGDLLVGGTFTTAGGVNANRIARWNGTNWSALGSGVADGANTYVTVHAIASMPNGDVVLGGDFTTAGGLAASRIARWNGTAWSPMGTGVPMPFGTTSARVRNLLVTANGDLVAAGNSSGILASGFVLQRWNGTAWTSFANGLTPGQSPYVSGLAELPDGDLVVGLTRVGISGAAASNSLGRFDGSAWSALATDLDGAVTTLTLLPDGTLEVGGAFAAIGTTVLAGHAQLVPTCPATLVALGSGCAGSGGPNVLTASGAWLGGTFRSTTTGLAAGSLAVAVFGLTPLALPMPSVHPAGVPGCTLWVDDDVLVDFVAANGAVTSEWSIPNQPALVGGVFHHQVVAVEVVSGAVTALSASNAVSATIGVF